MEANAQQVRYSHRRSEKSSSSGPAARGYDDAKAVLQASFGIVKLRKPSTQFRGAQ